MTRLLNSPRARRYTFQGLLTMGLMGLVVLIVLSNIGAGGNADAAEVQDEAQQQPGLPADVYSYVQSVRRQHVLDDMDLAALDLSQAECEAVLSQLAAWCQTNIDALDTAGQAVYTAERDLNLLERRIRIGQASSQELQMTFEKRSEAMRSAEQHRDTLWLSGAQQAAQAAPAKVDAWQRAAAIDSDLPVEPALRYVPGLDQKRLAQLNEEAKRLGVGVDEVLSFSEQQQLSSARARVITNMPLVRLAEASALPIPEEDRTPSELLLDPSTLED